MKKVLLLVFASLFFTASNAATTYLNVEQFELAAWYNGTLIDTKNLIPNSNPENCTKGGRYWTISNSASTTNSDFMLSLLLEARANGKTLGVGINGCQSNRPRVIVITR